MLFQMVNNVVMTLAEGLDVGDTTLVVMDRDLPDAERYDPARQLSLTLVGDEELNEYEVVYAQSRTGTTFTVLRGQEDTSQASWPGGTKVIAALTAGMLQGLTQTPTDADQIAYGGGNFGASGTVEETLDDMGDAIIRTIASTVYHEDVNERISGGIFTGITSQLVVADELRWQGFGGRTTTDGFGNPKVINATIAGPSVPPEVVICARSTTGAKMAQISVKLYNNAAPANSMTWTQGPLVFGANNAWTHFYFGLDTVVNAGDPNVNLPDRVEITLTDDGTGVLTFDMNFFDVFEQHRSYLGSFIKVATLADFDKVWAIEKYGYQVSIAANIEDIIAGTVDMPTLRKAEIDGNRIYMTSNAAMSGQTADQILVKLFTGSRLCAEADIRPAGFVYPAQYNGPLTTDPTITLRELVLQAYPRGVGVQSFRSAVDIYRFDDPLITVATLAEAQGLLTGADKRSININLTALSVADLNTLYAAVATGGNFYITSFEWQNADNIRSGTLAADRLPIVPIVKGGTGAADAVNARKNLGLEYDVNVAAVNGPWLAPVGVPLPWPNTTPPSGYTLLQGAVLTRTTYPLLFAAYGTKFNTGGETASQFRLPDMRGRIIAGLDNGTGRLPGITTIGQVFGDDMIALTATQLPAHVHSAGTLQAASAGAHVHTELGSTTTRTPASNNPGSSMAQGGGETGSAGAHVHDITGNTGNNTGTIGQAHSNVQPTMGWNWIARAA